MLLYQALLLVKYFSLLVIQVFKCLFRTSPTDKFRFTPPILSKWEN